MRLVILIAAFVIYSTSTCVAKDLPSFPGAVGYGAKATGGRAGKVCKVVNLNDSGIGSFRDCVTKSDVFVVFAIGGSISLGSEGISMMGDNITVAGQTAPGLGITIKGDEKITSTPLYIRGKNVIMRGITIRTGSSPKILDNVDAFTVYDGQNVIVDHATASWATDENISIWPGSDVTFSNLIAAEGLHQSTNPKGGHSKGILMGGKNSDRASLYYSIVRPCSRIKTH